MIHRLILFSLVFTLAGKALHPQVVEFVADINPTGNSEPYDLTPFNGKLYFSAMDSLDDRELWVTDGTGTGTKKIKEINTAGSSHPRYLTVYNDKLYFRAINDMYGYELWVSDGTDAGTQLVKDIDPTGSSYPHFFTVYNDKLYFEASDGIHGDELWVTDGTDTGTLMVKDIDPTGGSYPSSFIEYNGKLYFNATDGINGREIWVSDGTSAGTLMVKDIAISPGEGSFPSEFIVFDGKLYFSANDQISGYQLWVTDGTAAGTQVLKDILPVVGWDGASLEYSGKLYFGANDGIHGSELWVTDGTNSGTLLVKDMNPTGDGVPWGFAVYDGLLYFSSYNEVWFYENENYELWVSDGTTNGTEMFLDLTPWILGDSYPGHLTVFKNKLYFTAHDSTLIMKLWVTDGTIPGTMKIVPDISTEGFDVYNTDRFVELNDTLYFSADGDSTGEELWRVIDTSATTQVTQVTSRKNNLSIFPNPVKQELNVTTTFPVTVTIMNVLGKSVHRFPVTKKEMIDVSDWMRGVYFIKDETSEQVVKFVKE